MTAPTGSQFVRPKDHSCICQTLGVPRQSRGVTSVTQGARLAPLQDGPNGGEVAVTVREGTKELAGGKAEAAQGAFQGALQANRDEAIRAFLALYPKQSNLAPENRLRWLKERCRLPDPGDSSATGLPDMPTRYELEEFLEGAASEIPPEMRRSLQLYLLWSYFEQKHDAKRDALLARLLSDSDPDQWPAQEQYFLGCRMLKAQAKNEDPPPPSEGNQGDASGRFRASPGRPR